MTVSQMRASLWIAAAGMAGLSVWVTIRGASAISAASVANVPQPTSVKQGETVATELPALGDLETACQRDLRQPLYDPPPPAPPAPSPPPPPPAPPAFKLAGTVIEPGHCRAMLLRTDGKLEFKRIGESEDSAQVMEINRDSVRLKFHGQELVMKVEKKDHSGGD